MFRVSAALSGERLDRALVQLVLGLSRRDAQRLCAENRVLLRGRPAKKSDPIREGDTLAVDRGPTRVAIAAPLPLAIRMLTQHWVVVAKPALMPTAPRHSEETGTIANGLLCAFPEMQAVGHRALEPGLLHRLDNGTTGLLVAARSARAFERATLALKQSRWQKDYFALTGTTDLPDFGRITGRLEPHPGRTECVRPTSPVELSALHHCEHEGTPLGPFVTTFELVTRAGPIALVKVRVGPAFRHQIRAHLAAIGAPLVNDPIYGAPSDPRLLPGRHALHAARVAWAGEPDLPGFSVDEPLPEDLLALLRETAP